MVEETKESIVDDIYAEYPSGEALVGKVVSRRQLLQFRKKHLEAARALLKILNNELR